MQWMREMGTVRSNRVLRSFGGVWENFGVNFKKRDSRRSTYRTKLKSTSFRRKLNTLRPQASTYRILMPVVIITSRVSHYFTYPVDLIPVIRAWKERLEVDKLGHDSTQCPHVYWIRIVLAQEENLWGTIPSSRYVFSIRWFAFGLAGQAEVGEFDDANNILLFCSIWRGHGRHGDVIVQAYSCDEYVFWLHVAVKIASSVDMIEAGDNLAKDVTYKAASKSTTLASFDEMKEVALHGLEDEVELPGIG